MTKDEAVNRWLEGAEKNLKACLDMAKSGHRDWALFIGKIQEFFLWFKKLY